jgi:hypothetical protein
MRKAAAWSLTAQTLGCLQIVSARKRNKALAIQETKAHCLVTAERPLASIGGV